MSDFSFNHTFLELAHAFFKVHIKYSAIVILKRQLKRQPLTHRGHAIKTDFIPAPVFNLSYGTFFVTLVACQNERLLLSNQVRTFISHTFIMKIFK